MRLQIEDQKFLPNPHKMSTLESHLNRKRLTNLRQLLIGKRPYKNANLQIPGLGGSNFFNSWQYGEFQ